MRMAIHCSRSPSPDGPPGRRSGLGIKGTAVSGDSATVCGIERPLRQGDVAKMRLA